MRNLIFFFLVLFMLYPGNVFAETISHKITNEVTVPPPSVISVGRVVYSTTINPVIKAGRVFISKNPDGTGVAKVGDTIQLWVRKIGFTGTRIFTYNAYVSGCKSHTQMPPTDITSLFQGEGQYSITMRILDWCGETQTIDEMYIVNQIPDPTPSIAPTLSGPKPFLDLPWDYKSKGLSFTEAALAPSSYFDHEYPLLSSDLIEPYDEEDMKDVRSTTVTFQNADRTKKSYSAHDGYDYAFISHAFFGDPVLAAADGSAAYINACAACGNMVTVDHGNGYQTRYMHLQKDGLILDEAGKQVFVRAGEQIGKIGATGNVSPEGEDGAHIHFMVVEDKDNDGDFNDNIPDGVTDPYGWQSDHPDPWKSYAFDFNGERRAGNKSQYLWKKSLENKEVTMQPSGGTVEIPKFSITLADGVLDKQYTIKLTAASHASQGETIRSIGHTLLVMARDVLGGIITQFRKPFVLKVDYSTHDVSSYRPDSLYIYSSPDGVNWTREQTSLDPNAKIATASIDHLTYFALMGERRDIVAPITLAHLSGLEGDHKWFRSAVQMELSATDNTDGLGVDHILFKIDHGEWNKYGSPVQIGEDGHHIISFYATDKDGNVEKEQSVKFDIDTVAPEGSISFNPATQEIETHTVDPSDTVTKVLLAESKDENVIIRDRAGNTLTITGNKTKSTDNHAMFEIIRLTYNDDNIYTIAPHRLSVSFHIKEMVGKLDQMYVIADTMKIKLKYDGDTNKTEVSAPTKNTLDGMRILQLTTQNGTLDYTL